MLSGNPSPLELALDIYLGSYENCIQRRVCHRYDFPKDMHFWLEDYTAYILEPTSEIISFVFLGFTKIKWLAQGNKAAYFWIYFSSCESSWVM